MKMWVHADESTEGGDTDTAKGQRSVMRGKRTEKS